MGTVIDLTNKVELPPMFNVNDEETLIETISTLIENIILDDPLIYNNPDYKDMIIEYVIELLEVQFDCKYSEDDFEEIIPLIKESFKLLPYKLVPKRSFKKTFIRNPPNIKKLTEKINILKNKPQPEQKSSEWYEFRHNCLTASSIWKAFASESSKNQLIYDKCKPFDINKFSRVSTETPMHWGNKYEPVSIMFYEKHYNTKVHDYGCILHDKYSFLAASPDGINDCPLSDRYGRMLEIKNIFNREINGIPKMEYWIQTQVQMEVCDLNECDFLETRFVEYETYEEFENDGSFCRTEMHDLKGIIMYFVKDEKPLYEYAPLEISREEFEEWQDSIMEKNKDLMWLRNIYWKLDEVSCVLVLRNKPWFNSAIHVIQNVWNTITKEKEHGFEHRAPKKREKKLINETNRKCFIDVTKLTSDYNMSNEINNKLDDEQVNADDIKIVLFNK